MDPNLAHNAHAFSLLNSTILDKSLCLPVPQSLPRNLHYSCPKFLSATKIKGCIFRYIVSICVRRPTKGYMLFIILCHEINLSIWCPFLSINILSPQAICMNLMICSLICFLHPSRMSDIFCYLKILMQNHQLFLDDEYYNSLVYCDLFNECS